MQGELCWTLLQLCNFTSHVLRGALRILSDHADIVANIMRQGEQKCNADRDANLRAPCSPRPFCVEINGSWRNSEVKQSRLPLAHEVLPPPVRPNLSTPPGQ